MATREPKKNLTGLDDGPKAKVYNALVGYLMRNAVLSRVFRPNSWFTWEGRTTTDAAEIVVAQMPAIRITPAARDPQWSDPVSQKGMLTFDLELWVAGSCCDDIMNLWDAVEQAIYTSDDPTNSRAFEQRLVSLGAMTGQVSVLMCAMMPYNPGPGENAPVIGMYARGQLGVDVRINS